MARWLGSLLICFCLIMPGKAKAWEWWFYPWNWCRVHLTPDDDDDCLLSGDVAGAQEASSEAAPAVGTSENQSTTDAEAFLNSLPTDMQSQLQALGINTEWLRQLSSSGGGINNDVNTLIRELSQYYSRWQLMHHRAATFGLQCWNFFLGGANRVAAFTGLYLMALSLGASHQVASFAAGTVTGFSVLSSNLLAVEGANHVQYEGILSHWDFITLVPVFTATCVDVIMAWSSSAWLPVSVLLAVGIGLGLPTVLFHKVRYMCYAVKGCNVKAERLRANVPALVHEIGQYMIDHGYTMEAEHAGHRRDVYKYFLSGADRETLSKKMLHYACVSSPVNWRKNTLFSLLNSGLLDADKDEQSILRLLEEHAVEQRDSTLGHLLTAVGLVVIAAPSVLYGGADSATFVQMIYGGDACHGLNDTVVYASMHIMGLMMISCKSAASAMSFIDTGRRFAHWVRHYGEIKIYPHIYILNSIGVVVGAFYGVNVFGTIMGNVDKADCLDFGRAIIVSMAAGGAVGGFAFNFGSGASIARIPSTVAESWKAWNEHRGSHRPVNGNHEDASQSLLEADFQGYGATGNTIFQPSSSWLEQYELPDDLSGILEPEDRDNLSHNQQWRSYWQTLSAFIRRNNLTAKTVLRDNNCLYHSLISMFNLPVSVKNFKAQLLQTVYRLRADQNLSDTDAEFIAAMSHDQLKILEQQLIAEGALHNQLPDQAMVQLTAFTFNQSVTLMTIQGVQLIHPDNAGLLMPWNINTPIHNPVLVHNAIGHWSWLQPQQNSVLTPAVNTVNTTENNHAVAIELNPALIHHIIHWTQ